ncbi:hypothetical protein [Mesoplasma seiffertii]|uniref:hypothetical protein n=1 Tax=Mesoplasma seiffertii TaxID=28224 RepID=UPI00047E35CB|nr:hypothetical protein [Mesoplasma seiffertii]
MKQKQNAKKYADKYAEHIKLKWFYRFKILKPKIKRVKVKTDYVKNDIKNDRKTRKYFILLLLIFFIGTTSIAGVTVYTTVGIKQEELTIANLVDLENRVSRFDNQTYAYNEYFENEFKKEFQNDESLKEMQLLVINESPIKAESEITTITYQATFTLNKGYKWSDNTKENKVFNITILIDTKLIIDSDQVLQGIKSNLIDKTFESTEDVIKEISLVVLPVTGVAIQTIKYNEKIDAIEVEIIKETNYFWSDNYDSDSRTLTLNNIDDMLIKFVNFNDVKNEIEKAIAKANSEDPIKNAEDLKERLNAAKKDFEAVEALTVNDMGSDESEFYFEIKIHLKSNYKFANEISQDTFEIFIENKN